MYNQGDKDFTALVSKLKLNGIDIVYDGGYHQEAGLIVRQMRDQGLKTILMAGDALADREFASIAGPAAEGVLFTFGPDPRKRATAAPIVEKFKAKGIDPEGYTLYTYAAYQVWAQAVAKAGSVDGQKVAAAIHADTWDTVLGPLAFDKKGDITAIGWAVFRWDKDGNYDEITKSGRTNRRTRAALGLAEKFPLADLPQHRERIEQPETRLVTAPVRKAMPVNTKRPPITFSTRPRWARNRARNAANGSIANAAAMNGIPRPSE